MATSMKVQLKNQIDRRKNIKKSNNAFHIQHYLEV